MSANLTVDRFIPYIEDEFMILIRGKRTRVVLKEISTLVQSMRQGGGFALYFEGPSEQMLSQGTYKLEHRGAASFEIFFVPIARTQQGIRYEAIFT